MDLATKAGAERGVSGGVGRKAVVAAAAIFLSAAAAGGVRAGEIDPAPASPSPRLDPGEVVRIQLEALRGNDHANRGIAVAYRFASPRNKATTGPLPRFIRMIKRGPYRLMLEYEHASYSAVRIEGVHAVQRVTLIGRREVRSYDFVLERQSAPPYAGCWMTDSVLLVPGPERSI